MLRCIGMLFITFPTRTPETTMRVLEYIPVCIFGFIIQAILELPAVLFPSNAKLYSDSER